MMMRVNDDKKILKLFIYTNLVYIHDEKKNDICVCLHVLH